MRYPKLRELKEAIRALIKGPYTSRFPYKPHEPYEAFRGRPQFHEEDCIGCTACVNVCPSGALSFEDKSGNGRPRRVLTHRTDLCIFCGQCQANCPTEKGIMLTREFDLATTGKREELRHHIEKEFFLCDGCGEMVVPRDQYIWVANRLGPLMFSNPSLFLAYVDCFGAPATPAGLAMTSLRGVPIKIGTTKQFHETSEFKRPDRFKILCPKCRREAVLKS